MRTYRRLEVLARGGMGSVERVELREGRFRRVFARKRLLDAYRDDPEVREMFLEEARLAGLIRHPNVVSVVDVGEDSEGPFLVMELVDGVSLSELVASCREHGPLPLTAALDVAAQVADGLRAAHELRSPEGEPLGLIHRDLTPGNVLVGFDGLARITDFGIAKAAGQSSQTRTGVLKGKPSYMAPEQLRFRPIDQRADLFSFGCVLYELLAGRRLYSQRGVELPELVRRVVEEPPPDLHDVRAEAPDELVELAFELLAKDPADRPTSAADVAERLRAIHRQAVDEHGPSAITDLLEQRFAARRQELSSRRHASEAEVAVPRGPGRWIIAALATAVLGGLGWMAMRARVSDPQPGEGSASRTVIETETATERAIERATATETETETATETATETETETESATETTTTDAETGNASANRTAIGTTSGTGAATETRAEHEDVARPEASRARRSRNARPRAADEATDGIRRWGWEETR